MASYTDRSSPPLHPKQVDGTRHGRTEKRTRAYPAVRGSRGTNAYKRLLSKPWFVPRAFMRCGTLWERGSKRKRAILPWSPATCGTRAWPPHEANRQLRRALGFRLGRKVAPELRQGLGGGPRLFGQTSAGRPSAPPPVRPCAPRPTRAVAIVGVRRHALARPR